MPPTHAPSLIKITGSYLTHGIFISKYLLQEVHLLQVMDLDLEPQHQPKQHHLMSL